MCDYRKKYKTKSKTAIDYIKKLEKENTELAAELGHKRRVNSQLHSLFEELEKLIQFHYRKRR